MPSLWTYFGATADAMSDPTALPIRLNEAQRRYLLGLIRADVRKMERRIEKRPFVPAPGRRDTNVWKLERLRELRELLAVPREPMLRAAVTSESYRPETDEPVHMSDENESDTVQWHAVKPALY